MTEPISKKSIEDLEKGSQEAYKEVSDYIRKYILKYTGRYKEDPEDITQTVIMKLIDEFRKGKQSPEWENAGSYVKQIAENLLNNYEINYSLVPRIDDSHWSDLVKPSSIVSKWQLHNLPSAFGKLDAPQHFQVSNDRQLTTRYLSSTLIPFLNAVESIQHIFDDILHRPHTEMVVRHVAQYSPIDVNLEGAAEAIKVVKEDIIPWRRQHAKKIAALEEKQVQEEIKRKRAEALEIRARSKKEHAEAAKIQAEAAKLRQEAERMSIENARARFELDAAKLKFALELVDKMNPELPEAQRITQAVRLLPAINSIATSDVDIKLLES
jgi:hypothetical protein